MTVAPYGDRTSTHIFKRCHLDKIGNLSYIDIYENRAQKTTRMYANTPSPLKMGNEMSKLNPYLKTKRYSAFSAQFLPNPTKLTIMFKSLLFRTKQDISTP